MRIWVDAERTPRDAREIVRRASARLAVDVRFVTPRDVAPCADGSGVHAHLLANTDPGDVVVTPDATLGRALADRDVAAIDLRGGEFAAAPVDEAPGTMDLLASVRSLGTGDRGSPPYDDRARREFAATLDRVLARRT